MSIRITTGKLLTVAVVAAALAVGAAGLAQPPAAPGGGGGGGRGQRGGFGRGFGQATLATIPAPVLADGLKLSATQTSKIQAIQDQLRKDARALFTGQQQGGDRNEMMEKMGSLQEEAKKSIEGVLSESQAKAAPGYVKAIGSYPMVGIPLGAIPELKLTGSQRTQLTALAAAAQKQADDARAARQAANQANGGAGGAGAGPGAGGGGGGAQARMEMMKANSDKAAAILTSTQKAALAKYIADNPQRGFGGRGGGGGRRGGGGGAQGGGNGPV